MGKKPRLANIGHNFKGISKQGRRGMLDGEVWEEKEEEQ
jgi:hypothetical protein